MKLKLAPQDPLLVTAGRCISFRARRLHDYRYAFTLVRYVPGDTTDEDAYEGLRAEAKKRLLEGDWTQGAEYVLDGYDGYVPGLRRAA